MCIAHTTEPMRPISTEGMDKLNASQGDLGHKAYQLFLTSFSSSSALQPSCYIGTKPQQPFFSQQAEFQRDFLWLR